MSPDSERRARVALSFLAQPGDPVMGRALGTRSAAELLALVTGADADGEAVLVGRPEDDGLSRALPRWRDRLVEVPSVGRLAAWEQSGLRLVLPGDAEWPTQLDDLGDARPLLLWVRGTADLRFACLNSVAMVGSRAASGYGNHVALEMAATLAEHGVSVVSGGAKATNSQLMRTMVLAASHWQAKLTSLKRRPALVGTCASAGNHRAPLLAQPQGSRRPRSSSQSIRFGRCALIAA
jgi:DNA processing protein